LPVVFNVVLVKEGANRADQVNVGEFGEPGLVALVWWNPRWPGEILLSGAAEQGIETELLNASRKTLSQYRTAGRAGIVTVATGRGTDILLGGCPYHNGVSGPDPSFWKKVFFLPSNSYFASFSTSTFPLCH
jgi:preprotein translocase subunit SecA